MVLGDDCAAVSRQQPDVQLIHTRVQSAVLEPGGRPSAATTAPLLVRLPFHTHTHWHPLCAPGLGAACDMAVTKTTLRPALMGLIMV